MPAGISPGERVAFTVSDPWDFVTSAGSGPFKGAVVKTRMNPRTRSISLLVRCDAVIAYAGEATRSFVVESRLEGRPLDALATGKEVPCNLTGIDEAKAPPENPFDLSVQAPEGLLLVGSIRREAKGD